MDNLIQIFIINGLILNVLSSEYPLLIYSNGQQIYSSLLELNNTFKLYNNITLVNENDGSLAMDYSIKGNYIIYKSSRNPNNLYKLSIDLKKEKLFNSEKPLKQRSNEKLRDSIAVDWIHDLIYFNSDSGIHVMSILNKRMRAIILHDQDFENIVVNPLECFIICTKRSAMFKANQDGSNLKLMFDDEEIGNMYRTDRIYSIAIEFETKQIYFIVVITINHYHAQNTVTKLSSIDFNGNHRKLILKQEVNRVIYSYIHNLDIFQRNLFVFYSDVSLSVSTDGVIRNRIYDFVNVRTIKIIHPSRQPIASDKCVNTNCTHLCLPINSTAYHCLCPDIKVYNLSEKCVEYVGFIKKITNETRIPSSREYAADFSLIIIIISLLSLFILLLISAIISILIYRKYHPKQKKLNVLELGEQDEKMNKHNIAHVYEEIDYNEFVLHEYYDNTMEPNIYIQLHDNTEQNEYTEIH